MQESDSGSYQCIRSNEAGTVSGEAFLGVLGKNKMQIYHSASVQVLKETEIAKKLK